MNSEPLTRSERFAYQTLCFFYEFIWFLARDPLFSEGRPTKQRDEEVRTFRKQDFILNSTRTPGSQEEIERSKALLTTMGIGVGYLAGAMLIGKGLIITISGAIFFEYLGWDDPGYHLKAIGALMLLYFPPLFISVYLLFRGEYLTAAKIRRIIVPGLSLLASGLLGLASAISIILWTILSP